MIYNFRLVSDEVENFKREIQIDADATFLDLRNAICDCTGYDKSQMSSFFLCDEGWERDKEITLEDMGSDSSEDVYLMEDTPLSDLIEDEGQRLVWVFDYLTDRSFFIEMKNFITGKTLKDPLCTVSMGEAPQQSVDMDEFDAKIDAKAARVAADSDMDDDFYGSTEFNEDEFDAAGFDEMTFDE
ncbi:MAG: hypothetical protein HDR83_09120 [Bacteroides sp.]|nr:hypothetical protein [Bacteroidales bacterium]MBD5250724.1 hypothetical protein [Barnesiella sp.]MBD5254015.1 hypothetical protein [Barnesiella sp.]MBD5343856.1 hypothetical protein [Bacteroides sp.]MBD5369403.1 hypothetical protein [Bacteroides sp.]